MSKIQNIQLDFAFFQYLWRVYQVNKGTIKQSYKQLTKKLLDYNNPFENPRAYLREPQALERFCHNALVFAPDKTVLQSLREIENFDKSKIIPNEYIHFITNINFHYLVEETSQKQFILLVNKGREAWNCRSLFGVVLYRKPKSKIFVLQATMRCLRSIERTQQTARVYLSEENLAIPDAELEENFRLDIKELESSGSNKIVYEVRPTNPPRKIKINRIKKLFKVGEQIIDKPIDFELEKVDYEKYKIKETTRDAIRRRDARQIVTQDKTEIIEKKEFSEYTFYIEVASFAVCYKP